MKKILIFALSVAVILGASVYLASPTLAQVSSPSFFKKIGNAITTIVSSWTLGSASYPISSITATTGNFNTLNATSSTIGTLTISSVATGDLTVNNGNLNLASSTKAYKIAGTSVLNSNTLGSGILNSSLTQVGTIATGTWQGTAIGTAYGGTGATTTGDARTNLGLIAGGAGDIWVEKAGDTMTGSLVIGGTATSTITGDGTDSTIGGNLIVGGTGTSTIGSNITFLPNATGATPKLQITGTGGDTGIDLATNDQYLKARVISNDVSATPQDIYLMPGTDGNLYFHSDGVNAWTIRTGTHDFVSGTDGSAAYDITTAGTITGGTLTGGTLTDGALTMAAGDITSVNSIAATTFTDGTATLTGGGLSGANGNISMWTNDSGYLQNTNAITNIVTVTEIDAKIATTTNLFTVPADKVAIITGAVIRCREEDTITVVPTLGIGIAAGEDDIISSTPMTGLDTVTEFYRFSVEGVAVRGTADDVIKLGIDVGATATSMTIDVALFGYLVSD
jgi:hypothetical protein